jgi:hypothetical protein
LNREYHAYARLPDVFLEHICHKLNQGKHPKVHEHGIEDKGVHKRLIREQWVKCEAKDSHAYSYITFYCCEHHVIAYEGEDNRGQDTDTRGL